MNIAVKKVELIEWLTRVQDESLLEKIELLKKQAIRESYEMRLKPMSSEKYKSMLDQAEMEYQAGNTTSQEGLEKESENKLQVK